MNESTVALEGNVPVCPAFVAAGVAVFVAGFACEKAAGGSTKTIAASSTIRFFKTFLRKLKCPASAVIFLGDGKATPGAERLLRYLYSRRRLLPLVFRPLDHRDDGLHQPAIEAARLRDLFHRLVILDVVFEDGVEHLVWRQRVGIFLSGTQLCRRRFLD